MRKREISKSEYTSAFGDCQIFDDVIIKTAQSTSWDDDH